MYYNMTFGTQIEISSKIAPIATMYGMILHSRYVQNSCIQRMFTTLRYHADNKVIDGYICTEV